MVQRVDYPFIQKRAFEISSIVTNREDSALRHCAATVSAVYSTSFGLSSSRRAAILTVMQMLYDQLRAHHSITIRVIRAVSGQQSGDVHTRVETGCGFDASVVPDPYRLITSWDAPNIGYSMFFSWRTMDRWDRVSP